MATFRRFVLSSLGLLRLWGFWAGAALADRVPASSSSPPPGAPVDSRKSVLILFAEQPHLPWVAQISAGIYSVFEDASPSRRPIIVTDFLDVVRAPDLAKAEADWLRRRYSGRRFDVIIAVPNPALALLMPLRDEMWPETPVILVTPSQSVEALSLPRGVTAMQARFENGKTLDVARALLPGTRRVAFVGESWTGSEGFRQEVAARGLELIDLSGLRVEELQSRVRALPEDTIVYFYSFHSDPTGRRFIPRDVMQSLAPSANRPIFGASATGMGKGMVGGWLLDFKEVGADTGRLALRVLDGEPVTALLAPATPSRLVFDDRELRRWHIPRSRLPPGSEVLFGDLPFWRRYPGLTAAAAVILLLQASLIGLLLAERRRLRSAQELTVASLAAVPSAVVAIDRKGRILHVNARWKDLTLAGADATGPGGNYLEACHRAARSGEEDQKLLTLVESVLNGDRQHGSLTYRRRGPDGDQWFDTHAQVLGQPGRGAVIAYRDVTQRHRGDAERIRHRDEIAHLNRVAAMGELASSLAHELNQPLTAIVANAQAARRLLSQGSEAAGELSEILNDIIDDDQRAGEIIRRMRSFVRKEETLRSPVALNDVVRGVHHLVTTDASLRRISVVLELAPELPPISGDHVQLQQVALNLVLNGLDAAAERPVGARRVEIRTAAGNGSVGLSVSDSGQGIPAGDLPRIFEPFFTTKANGLGMGLSICRTIVEAHAGDIQAENRQDGGAAFHCRFPAAEGPLA